MPIESINPATEEVLATFDEHTPQQIEAAITETHEAASIWAGTPFAERAQLMRQAAAYMRERKPHLARLMTLEMGKPITEAEAEVDKCAWVCEYYADNAEDFLA